MEGIICKWKSDKRFFLSLYHTNDAFSKVFFKIKIKLGIFIGKVKRGKKNEVKFTFLFSPKAYNRASMRLCDSSEGLRKIFFAQFYVPLHFCRQLNLPNFY
jgi:hypothetical protein